MTNLYALALMFTVPLLGIFGLALGHITVPRLVTDLVVNRTPLPAAVRSLRPRSRPLTRLFLLALALPMVGIAGLLEVGSWLVGANAGVHPIALGMIGSFVGWLLAERPGRRGVVIAAGIAWSCGMFTAEKMLTLSPRWGSQLAVVAPGNTLEPRWHSWFTGIQRIVHGPTLLTYNDDAPLPESSTGCIALEVERSWRLRGRLAGDSDGVTRVYEGTVVATSGDAGQWAGEPLQLETIGVDQRTLRRPDVVVVPTHLSTVTGLWVPDRPDDAARIEATCVGLLDDPALLAVL